MFSVDIQPLTKERVMYKALSYICAVAGILSLLAGQWAQAIGMCGVASYFWGRAKDQDVQEAILQD